MGGRSGWSQDPPYYTQLSLTYPKSLSSGACLGKHGLENPRVAVPGWTPRGQDPCSAPSSSPLKQRLCGRSHAMALAGISMATPLSASGKPRVASERHDRLFQSKQNSIVICQDKFCNKQNKTKTGSKSRPGQALFCHSRDLLLGTPGPNKDKMVLQLLLNCCDRTP